MAENFLRTDIDNNSEAKEGQRNSNRITKKKDTQIQHGSYSETVGSLKIDFKAFKGEKKKKTLSVKEKRKKKDKFSRTKLEARRQLKGYSKKKNSSQNFISIQNYHLGMNVIYRCLAKKKTVEMK